MGKRTTVDDLRSAASGQWAGILARLGSIDSGLLDGRHHPCPKCGGTDRFRLIDEDAGAVLCNQCFREKNGDGFAALSWLTGWDFRTTINTIADDLGLDHPKLGDNNATKRKLADPAEHLDFLPWNESQAALWCLKKPGLTPEGIRQAGGVLARYRNQYTVVTFAIFGSAGTKAKPVGWQMHNVTGGPLPVFHGKGKEITWKKVKNTKGSKPGIMGAAALNRIGSAEVIWLVEGSTDLAAITSAIPLTASRHVAIANANGAEETPPKWLMTQLAGRRVNIVRDTDDSGERGGKKWSKAAALAGVDVRLVILPYGVTKSGGKDIRDLLTDGHSYNHLLILASRADAITVDQTDSDTGSKPIEADDDPHRLARLFIDQYATVRDVGRTLRYWREEWWQWRDGRYISRSNPELLADLRFAIKQEFDRINIDQQQSTSGDPAVTRKVTQTLMVSVSRVVEGLLICDASEEQSSWLD